MDFASSEAARERASATPDARGADVTRGADAAAASPGAIPPGIPLVAGTAISTKIVVAGGFGVGKTTFVGSVSEIPPLTTEAVMTEAGRGVDDVDAVPGKRTTTVAMDFGRISLESDLVLYLFGTPGQGRFWFMWDDLVRGAVGAVILADTRRPADCFPALDYFEGTGLPFVVAVNQFDGAPVYSAEAVRDSLALPEHIPLLLCDARQRSSSVEVLTALVVHALAAESAPAGQH